jgi:hypothetical protein
MAAAGLTGGQSTKWLAADRVFIKTKDSTPTPVLVKSNGTVPAGWTDLGIINGKVRFSLEKEINEIRTGVDQVLRQQYVGQKSATFEFALSQFDDVVLKELTGLTPSQITSGSIYQFALGSEDIVEKALLLVSQNKLDGKEWQFYHPAGQLSLVVEDDGEFTVVRGTGALTAFTWGSTETLMVATNFA